MQKTRETQETKEPKETKETRKLKRRVKPTKSTKIEKDSLDHLDSLEKAQAERKKIKVSKRKRKTRKRSTRKKKIIKYPQNRCAFVDEGGYRCKGYAYGSSTLCKKHGGSISKEDLISDRDLEEMHKLRIKFNPAVHPMSYIQLSREGFSDAEIAATFEVSKGTLENWAEKYESFYHATEIGKEMQEAWWLNQGRNNLENKRDFNTGLFKFLTMNKLGYSDKIESKSTSMNMHGVLMIPDAVSEDDWEKEAIDVN